jgi:hypothetical protein
VSRSRRMVISEAPASSASSGTVTLPESFTAWAISLCHPKAALYAGES